MHREARSGRAPETCCTSDVKTYARFDSPGRALTGDPSRPGKEKRKHLGQNYAHAAVDDHSRLAFSELYLDERSPSVTQVVEYTLAFYARHGIMIRGDPHRPRSQSFTERSYSIAIWTYRRERA